MFALLAAVALAVLLRALWVLVALWRTVPRSNDDFGLE
jgi:hypothetical protein